MELYSQTVNPHHLKGVASCRRGPCGSCSRNPSGPKSLGPRCSSPRCPSRSRNCCGRAVKGREVGRNWENFGGKVWSEQMWCIFECFGWFQMILAATLRATLSMVLSCQSAGLGQFYQQVLRARWTTIKWRRNSTNGFKNQILGFINDHEMRICSVVQPTEQLAGFKDPLLGIQPYTGQSSIFKRSILQLPVGFSPRLDLFLPDGELPAWFLAGFFSKILLMFVEFPGSSHLFHKLGTHPLRG